MQYDFAFGAYQSQQLDVRGKFFKLASAAGTVRVKTNTGDSIDLLPGQGVWGVDFQWLSVQDRTGADNSGTILAGGFDFHDDRITGTVDMVDGGKARTLANTAFSVAGYFPPDATHYATCQIWNPAGSGKRVIIEKAYMSSDVAGRLTIGFSNAVIQGDGGNTCQSKLAGGVSGAAKRAAAGLVGLPGGFLYLSQLDIPASQMVPLDFREPLILPSGWGFVVQQSVMNAALNCTTEFFEEVI